jgi:hypothetical protein
MKGTALMPIKTINGEPIGPVGHLANLMERHAVTLARFEDEAATIAAFEKWFAASVTFNAGSRIKASDAYESYRARSALCTSHKKFGDLFSAYVLRNAKVGKMKSNGSVFYVGLHLVGIADDSPSTRRAKAKKTFPIDETSEVFELTDLAEIRANIRQVANEIGAIVADLVEEGLNDIFERHGRRRRR